MEELVFLQSLKDEPYTTSEVIAENTNNKRRSVQRLITNQKSRLEQFGKVRFEITPLPSGQKAKVYKLNEQQATLLITFLDNTEQVADFKTALVDEFFKLRDEKARWQLQRLSEQPIKRALQEAVKNWVHYQPYMYKNINNLLLKSVTGFDAKKLKKLRGDAKAGLDLLTTDEQEIYAENERKTIAYIEAGFTYKQIKALLTGAKLFIAVDEKAD